jgi:hypothetical protein
LVGRRSLRELVPTRDSGNATLTSTIAAVKSRESITLNLPAPMTPHPASLPLPQLLRECRVERTRRSGPGGQRRNKVQTAVVLVHLPTGVRAQASERRESMQNRAMALFRLRLALAVQVRMRRAGAGPSELWRRRTSGGRILVNERHADFPTLLAEALDVLAESGFEVSPAALRLGCTPTQLIRLLKRTPQALARVNEERLRQGLHALQ